MNYFFNFAQNSKLVKKISIKFWKIDKNFRFRSEWKEFFRELENSNENWPTRKKFSDPLEAEFERDVLRIFCGQISLIDEIVRCWKFGSNLATKSKFYQCPTNQNQNENQNQNQNEFELLLTKLNASQFSFILGIDLQSVNSWTKNSIGLLKIAFSALVFNNPTAVALKISPKISASYYRAFLDKFLSKVRKKFETFMQIFSLNSRLGRGRDRIRGLGVGGRNGGLELEGGRMGGLRWRGDGGLEGEGNGGGGMKRSQASVEERWRFRGGSAPSGLMNTVYLLFLNVF